MSGEDSNEICAMVCFSQGDEASWGGMGDCLSSEKVDLLI